jgi:hypothetical protein
MSTVLTNLVRKMRVGAIAAPPAASHVLGPRGENPWESRLFAPRPQLILSENQNMRYPPLRGRSANLRAPQKRESYGASMSEAEKAISMIAGSPQLGRRRGLAA